MLELRGKHKVARIFYLMERLHHTNGQVHSRWTKSWLLDDCRYEHSSKINRSTKVYVTYNTSWNRWWLLVPLSHPATTITSTSLHRNQVGKSTDILTVDLDDFGIYTIYKYCSVDRIQLDVFFLNVIIRPLFNSSYVRSIFMLRVWPTRNNDLTYTTEDENGLGSN